jgi:hypothetical protein
MTGMQAPYADDVEQRIDYRATLST